MFPLTETSFMEGHWRRKRCVQWLFSFNMIYTLLWLIGRELRCAEFRNKVCGGGTVEYECHLCNHYFFSWKLTWSKAGNTIHRGFPPFTCSSLCTPFSRYQPSWDYIVLPTAWLTTTIRQICNAVMQFGTHDARQSRRHHPKYHLCQGSEISKV